MQIDVSVIIVNYKTSNLVRDCVKSIIEKTEKVGYEVIIVDNNSEEDFEEKISSGIPESLKENFKFLSLPENVGFGRANNAGVGIARGRNLFFLNPDTILLNNAIKILADFLDAHKDVGACGGNLYDVDRNPTYSYKLMTPGIIWELNELLNNIPYRIFYRKSGYFNPGEKPKEVGFITGADLMIRKNVFDEVDGFCKRFFMYYEETDLCYKIKKAGWKIYSVPQSHILHLESKSFDSEKKYQSDLKTRFMEDGRKVFYDENKGKFSRKISDMIYWLFLCSRVALIKNPSKRSYYKSRLHYFRTNS